MPYFDAYKRPFSMDGIIAIYQRRFMSVNPVKPFIKEDEEVYKGLQFYDYSRIEKI